MSACMHSVAVRVSGAASLSSGLTIQAPHGGKITAVVHPSSDQTLYCRGTVSRQRGQGVCVNPLSSREVATTLTLSSGQGWTSPGLKSISSFLPVIFMLDNHHRQGSLKDF
jgi:hypothetical protein